jgi:Na+-transporting methylmalonyl-CoA/oxaloacetate decarboxylase beta subunit
VERLRSLSLATVALAGDIKVDLAPEIGDNYPRSLYMANYMSNMNIVQLLASQRERDVRAQHTPGGPSNWLAFPFLYVFVVCLVLSVMVTFIAALVLRSILRVAKGDRDEAARPV